MSEPAVSDPMVLHPADIEVFDRGNGVATTPLVGKWNAQGNRITSGITSFAPRTGLPLHTHNVEETVLILEGEATAVVGEQEFVLSADDVTWVPAGVPHKFHHITEDLRVMVVFSPPES